MLILGFTILGCAPKLYPIDGYRELQQRKNISKFDASATALTIGADYKTVLETTDSVAVYDTLGMRTYYKNFKVKLKPDAKYKVSISSLCDCFGFEKYLFYPGLRIADGNGHIIVARPFEEFSYDYRFGPLSLNASYVFESFDDSEHLISVFSYNDHLDQPTFRYYTVPIPMNINIKKTLVGTFHLKIEEIKP